MCVMGGTSSAFYLQGKTVQRIGWYRVGNDNQVFVLSNVTFIRLWNQQHPLIIPFVSNLDWSCVAWRIRVMMRWCIESCFMKGDRLHAVPLNGHESSLWEAALGPSVLSLTNQLVFTCPTPKFWRENHFKRSCSHIVEVKNKRNRCNQQPYFFPILWNSNDFLSSIISIF
jgi:hypothetical protein